MKLIIEVNNPKPKYFLLILIKSSIGPSLKICPKELSIVNKGIPKIKKKDKKGIKKIAP
jgi:hypothetical protein